MASHSIKTEARRKRNHQKGGLKRKTREALKSTLSAVEMFAACGEPGKPAPKPRA